MKILVTLIAAVGVLVIAGDSMALTPWNQTVCVMEPMLWDPNVPDASGVFDDLDWGMGLIWDWVLNDSGISLDSVESWLGFDFGIWLYSCKHNYGTTYESILVSTYASESARNSVLDSHSGYESFDGPNFYGILMPNDKIAECYSSANSIVHLDICYGLSVIDGGFNGYGVGLGYSGEVYSDVAALDLVNFWLALIDLSTGVRTVSQAMTASGAKLEYGTSSQVNISLYPLDPVLAASGSISWSLENGTGRISVMTNVDPIEGLELAKQDLDGYDLFVWDQADFASAMSRSAGTYTFSDSVIGAESRYYVLRLRVAERLLELDKLLVNEKYPPTVNIEAAPNPFNPQVRLEVLLPKDMSMAIDVFDSRGRFIRNLLQWGKWPAKVGVTWDGKDSGGHQIGSGLYFVRVRTEEGMSQKKVTLLK